LGRDASHKPEGTPHEERTAMNSEAAGHRSPWSLVRKAVKFDCPYFSARDDLVAFDGSPPFSYSSIRVKKHGVCVAPIDPQGCVTIVGQYRYVLDRYTWELPGGGADVGADALAAAQAELAEETGLHGRHWLKLIDAPVACGTSDEQVPGYVAWDLESGKPNPDPVERLTLHRIPFAEAISMALGGTLEHLAGIALLLSIDAKLRRNQLPVTLTRLLRKR